MDERIKEALELEYDRQKNNIELIASENYASKAVMELQGSIFTNKYAEGYPNKRYYGGCINVDKVESLAQEYLTKIFGCKYSNVQPHSGSSANMAVYRALLENGDTVLGMDLSNGGHLTHGHPMNFSGIDYNIVSYKVDDNGFIDYDNILKLAKEHKPKMIIAGASAYSRIIDFKKFKEISEEVGAYLMVDMAHIAGLVAAGLHPSPVPYADVVTSTTHKTLRGPRGGIILTNNEDIINKVNKIVFPGIQGGPLMHVIAAKAQCFYEALKPEFIDYQKQVILNMKAMSDYFKENSIKVISDGTDNHLILLDIKSSFNMTGKQAEGILEQVNITVNKNTIPNETESPFKTSGIRIGSAAMTTRGFKEEEFIQVAKYIIKALNNYENEEILANIKKNVIELTSKFQL